MQYNEIMKLKRILTLIFFTVYTSIFVFLCFQSCLNAEQSANESNKIIKVIEKTEIYHQLEPKVDDLPGLVRKLFGHFMTNFALGFFGFLSWVFAFDSNKNKGVALTLCIGFALCLVTELIQFIAKNRAPLISDVILNYNGYLASTLILFTVYDLTEKTGFQPNPTCLATIFGASVTSIVGYLVFSQKTDNYAICFATFFFVLLMSVISVLIKETVRKRHKEK